MKLSRYLLALVTSLFASLGARVLHAPGMTFDTFGRWMGLRLALHGLAESASLLVRPVSIVRYFEFPFALSCLQKRHFERCLDISSPLLFSLFLRWKGIVDQICMINPDTKDIALTGEIVARLQVKGLTTQKTTIKEFADPRPYDAIWSLSVIEHIAGETGDSEAVEKMFSLLIPGGRLILTLPVGQEYLIQNRAVDIYCMGHPVSQDGLRFFQRVYDGQSIRERVVNAVGRRPTVCRWFGEKVSGIYSAYEKGWIKEGIRVTATDSWRIARSYQEYARWEDMPGLGVCGLVFDKVGKK